MHALAVSLNFAATLAQAESNLVEIERHASDLIELSARYDFGHWMAIGTVYRGWARSVSGDTAVGIAWIEDGIRNYRATGAILGVPNFQMLKAEALYLAGRTPEAVAAITEAEILAKSIEVRCWSAELQLLSSIFHATTGADETQIEVSFLEAIRIAKEQKSVSLALVNCHLACSIAYPRPAIIAWIALRG